ncbi:MAG TPA: thiamine phosphate synthase [Vicinamibacterales bacterium]|nr:thiamine phosphate synthase [Vicinamibacterales bacterium]
MRPVVCMITDRQRFGGNAEDLLIARVAAAAAAGVDLVQVRERDMEGAALTRLVTRCVQATTGTRTRVLVNDRLDIAIAAGAHGVHLRGDSMPAHRARALTPPGFLIGRSVHTVDEAVRVTADGGLDYLLLGAVFDTQSKPGAVAAGIDVLAGVAAATALPVLAVGGVTANRVHQLAGTGCAGFAAIGFFAGDEGEPLEEVVAAASQAFEKG